MPKNLLLVVALALVAVLSILSLLFSGVISLGDGEQSFEEQLAALNLGEQFDADASRVRVAPFNVTIIQDGKVHGALYVLIDLETGDRSLNIGVAKARPKLRDAYLKTLTRYSSHQIDPGKPVNIMLIKRLLQRSTDEILGDLSATVVVSAAHISKPIR